MGEDPAAEARPESSAPSNANGGDGDRTVTVPFVVSMFDTFASICLKHRMSADELMRLNGLRHRRARVGDVLLVWAERSDAEQSEHWQRRLLRQFRRQTGCPAGEALYYMEQHEYRIGDAIRERLQDLRFEHEHGAIVDVINSEERAKAQATALAQVEAMHITDKDSGPVINRLLSCVTGMNGGCLPRPPPQPSVPRAPIEVI